jgi:glutathione peroxidase
VSILDAGIARLDGTPATLGELTGGSAALLVNVASQCGLTPQYAGLQRLHDRYADRGFTVVGLPCNQFMGQEPGTAAQIAEFCSETYAVTFPMTEKIEVNGDGRHEVYRSLTTAADDKGTSGDVAWNFEKFLVDSSGTVVARFRPEVEPDDPRLVAAVERLLG